MAGDKIHVYKAEHIDVHYSLKRCIHAEECVSRLQAVFDKRKRPWIQPENAPADDIAATIEHCPTGALHYVRKDAGDPEQTPEHNRLHMAANGPLYVRGAMTLKSSDGTVLLEDTRVALCRCGASKNKPFCDNSHLALEFKAVDNLAENEHKSVTGESAGQGITISTQAGGPYHLEGSFTIYSADKGVEFRGHEAWLCRCGGSEHKPFCDSTHTKIGFSAP